MNVKFTLPPKPTPQLDAWDDHKLRILTGSQGKTPSNKSLAPLKSMNMDSWEIDTSNLQFLKGSQNEMKFSKK